MSRTVSLFADVQAFDQEGEPFGGELRAKVYEVTNVPSDVSDMQLHQMLDLFVERGYLYDPDDEDGILYHLEWQEEWLEIFASLIGEE